MSSAHLTTALLLLTCWGCTAPATSEDHDRERLIEPWQLEDKATPTSVARTDLFFTLDELMPVLEPGEMPFIDSGEIKAMLAFEFLGISRQGWDLYADRTIWHEEGKTYAQITFPNAVLNEPRTFELALDIDRERFRDRWKSPWEDNMYVNYAKRHISLSWGPRISREYVEANYSKAHLKVWNTYAGVIIDQHYTIIWSALNSFTAYCPPPVLKRNHIKCL